MTPLLAVFVAAAAEPRVIELYGREGCARCEEAAAWLTRLDAARADVELRRYDVGADPAARARLEEAAGRAGTPLPGVPAIVVDDAVVVGFSAQETPRRVEALLAGEIPPDAGSGEVCPPEAGAPCEDGVDLPILGRVRAGDLGLPLFTVAVGLVDGFNPCATWVLLFLLSILVSLHDRARMFAVAGVFVLVSGAVYFAFMAAWLSVFRVLGVSRAVQVVLGVVAVVFGLVNVKDFFALHRGVTLSIPESAHPLIARRASRVLHARGLVGALAGATVLAVLVNLLELLCTAGLPAVYTQVLARQGLPDRAYFAYLALYVGAYMVDDALLVGVAVATLRRMRLREKGGRRLKLLSGAVLVAMGAVLLLRPGWLAW